jgi:hypothetical protein
VFFKDNSGNNIQERLEGVGLIPTIQGSDDKSWDSAGDGVKRREQTSKEIW